MTTIDKTKRWVSSKITFKKIHFSVKTILVDDLRFAVEDHLSVEDHLVLVDKLYHSVHA